VGLLTYLPYSRDKAIKSGALTLFMFAFWVPLLLLAGVIISICVLDFLYYNNLAAQVRSLTLPSLFYVLLPMLGVCVLSIFVWWRGYMASLRAYAINDAENIIYAITYDKGVSAALTTYFGSRLAGSVMRNNIGEIGTLAATGILVFNFSAARRFLSDKNNLAIMVEYKHDLPVDEMKNWKVIYTNNKRTKIQGAVRGRNGVPKIKTWTIYNICENYEAISEGGVANA
jgi:hypothetical protein